MNLHHLRAFLVVAEEKNITRGARRLHTSQPAASKHVSDLEAELGVSLFDRLPRGVRLTEAGELLLRHARRLFAVESAAETELGELAGLTRGSLSIGASTTIGSYLLPRVFGQFNRVHPHITLSLHIANTAQVQTLVLDDGIDFGLTEGFAAAEQLEVEVVHYDEMVAIVSPDHPILARGRLCTRDLASVPFICREPGSGTRDVIEAELERHGLSLEPVMALGSTEAVKNAVSAGLGLAIVSRLAVELELSVGRLTQLAIEDLSIRRALHLVQLRGKQASPAAQAFIALLRATLA